MCGVSLSVPTNIKNNPNNIDKLFRTIPEDAAILNLSKITVRCSLKAVVNVFARKLSNRKKN